MKASNISSKKSPSSYDKPSDYLIKWTLLKSPYFYSRALKFTKHVSSMTLEGDTLLQIQKLRDAIISYFFQSLSKNNIWPPYKKLKVKDHSISKFLLPPDTHYKNATAK